MPLLEFLIDYKEEIPLTILLMIVFIYSIKVVIIWTSNFYTKYSSKDSTNNKNLTDNMEKKQDKIEECIQDMKIVLTMINKDIEEIKKISDYHDKTQNEKINNLTSKMSRIYDDFDDIMEMVKQIIIKNNKL